MTQSKQLTYGDALDLLLRRLDFAGSRDRNTKNTKLLHELLGSPADSYPIVHVTGTNGKGSTSAKIAYGLQLSGQKVGLYASPHISSFCERIRINGETISEENFALYLDRVTQFEIEPTFFEALTLVAFLYFAEQKVDVAVIEVGIGGTLDPTNICKPILSVITAIAIDHEKYLGGTLESIAKEKAGVIKKGVPVVLGTRAQLPVVLDRAKEMGSQPIFGIMSDGHFDDENNETASLALKELSKTFPITDEMICKAMLTRPRGRFEVIPKISGIQRGFKAFPPYVILDVAHNPDAIKALFRSISLKMPSLPIRTVISVSEGHNEKEVLAEVEKYSAHVHPVSLENSRSLSYDQLSSHLKDPKRINSIEEAIELAAENDEILLFCGSCFLMSGVRDALKFNEPRDPDQHLGRFKNRLKF